MCRSFEVRLPCHGRRLRRGVRPIYLEGSTAFGAGDHPTTRGCAAVLEATVRPGQRVLDYGTGSGVLAILAALLGARALGLDVDAAAVASARRSARASGADATFHQVAEHGAEMRRRVAQEGPFDVVVANLLLEPLLELRPALAAAPGAQLCRGRWRNSTWHRPGQ